MTETAEPAPRSDHDSPWKEALEGYFPEFLALLFPRIHAGIDWMIRLPRTLENCLLQELYTYEETKQMPYVTSAERFGIEKGYRQGEADLLLWQIEKKFGEVSANALRERVAAADSDTLRLWSERILTADTPGALFQ
jgi:hypothetical protein